MRGEQQKCPHTHCHLSDLAFLHWVSCKIPFDEGHQNPSLEVKDLV